MQLLFLFNVMFSRTVQFDQQNNMLSTPTPNSPFNPPSPSSHSSSPSPSLQKSSSFMQRFKLNQNQLRSKFRKFVLKQKVLFPKTHQKMNITFMTEDSEKAQPEDVRSIRKEKHRLQEEMKEAMNQSQYYLHRNQQYERTCQQLQQRVRRVEMIRQDRREQVSKLQSALREIGESIHYQKLRFRDSIKASKSNITRSKMLCSRRKLTQALSVRHQSRLHRSRIIEERTESEEHNRRKFLSVKKEQRNAEISVSRVVEQKAGRAREVKLERLFRELAEKEEVKISSMKVREEAQSIITKYKNKTVELQQRITRYRQSLGQRQPQPTPRITRIKFQNRRYHTAENEFSTKSGFLTSNKEVNYGDEPFDD